jgi:hypothetical protein
MAMDNLDQGAASLSERTPVSGGHRGRYRW